MPFLLGITNFRLSRSHPFSPECEAESDGCDFSVTDCAGGSDSSSPQGDEGDESAFDTCSGTEEFSLAGAFLPSLDGCYMNTLGLEGVFGDSNVFSLTGEVENGPFILADTTNLNEVSCLCV